MRFLCFEIKYMPRNIFLKSKKIRKLVLKEWIETNNKIKAIKKHRELTECRLRESKNYCDELQEIAMQKLRK